MKPINTHANQPFQATFKNARTWQVQPDTSGVFVVMNWHEQMLSTTFAQNMCTLMNDWNYFVKANAANSTLPAPAPLFR